MPYSEKTEKSPEFGSEARVEESPDVLETEMQLQSPIRINRKDINLFPRKGTTEQKNKLENSNRKPFESK